MLGNQIVFTPSIQVIPFSKYLSFHVGVVLVHANWANLIIVLYTDFCTPNLFFVGGVAKSHVELSTLEHVQTQQTYIATLPHRGKLNCVKLFVLR